MLIIQGKAGKSLIIQVQIDKLAKDIHDVIVIDYVGVKHLTGNYHFCSKGYDMKLENIYNDFMKDKDSFRYFKTIIFEVNAPVSMINIFKQIETETSKNIIVTIQDNDLEELKIYEI